MRALIYNHSGELEKMIKDLPPTNFYFLPVKEKRVLPVTDFQDFTPRQRQFRLSNVNKERTIAIYKEI